jgi:DNA repair protein RecN (Recombination protein N)
VVTHLAQVAAFADQQILVEKSQRSAGATTTATVLDDEARVVELSRMLSGTPDSDAARQHAKELLDGVVGTARRPGRR